MYGELNTNARLFTAEMVCEPLPVILGTVLALDSATNCLESEDFQRSCEDLDCPRCNGGVLSISTLKGTTACAVIMQDLVDRAPHATQDDGVAPMDYRCNYFGNFPFTTLDQKVFKDRLGGFIYSYSHFEISRNSVYI